MNYLAAVAVALLIVTVSAMILAWPVMVLLGVFASLTGFPTAIGFWATFVLVFIVKLLTSEGGSTS